MAKGKSAPTAKEAKQDKPLIPEIPKSKRHQVASNPPKQFTRGKGRK